ALYYLNILDTVLTFIIPFLLITFMNFMISRAIYRFYVRYRKQRAMPDAHMDCRDSSESTCSCCPWDTRPPPDGEHSSLPYVLQRYFMLLYYTNFAINFVLYNASSRMFRATLCEYMQSRWLALRESMAGIRSSLGRSSSSQNEDIII
ncbi:hypothetical protein MTO96_038793, partial [Rhipicephalus appendiculatus]